ARLDMAELVLCEGAMGLFDGIGATGEGSAAELACITRWPVILVVDAAGIGASIAALVKGFVQHRTDCEIAGVILNRVGSAHHCGLLAAALAAELPDLKLLGAVSRDGNLALPSRHLGLVQAGEHDDLERFLDEAAAQVAGAVDLDTLIALARPSALLQR